MWPFYKVDFRVQIRCKVLYPLGLLKSQRIIVEKKKTFCLTFSQSIVFHTMKFLFHIETSLFIDWAKLVIFLFCWKDLIYTIVVLFHWWMEQSICEQESSWSLLGRSWFYHFFSFFHWFFWRCFVNVLNKKKITMFFSLCSYFPRMIIETWHDWCMTNFFEVHFLFLLTNSVKYWHQAWNFFFSWSKT